MPTPSEIETGRTLPQELVLDLGFFAASGIDSFFEEKKDRNSSDKLQQCALRAPKALSFWTITTFETSPPAGGRPSTQTETVAKAKRWKDEAATTTISVRRVS